MSKISAIPLTPRSVEVISKQIEDADADRSVAIVAFAFVEEQLRAAAVRFFPANKQTEALSLLSGPLGGTRICSDFLYALDEFGPVTREDLNHMAQIRNLFAHVSCVYTSATTDLVEPSFSHGRIKRLCWQLETVAKGAIEFKEWSQEDARNHFKNVAMCIGLSLSVPKEKRDANGQYCPLV